MMYVLILGPNFVPNVGRQVFALYCGPFVTVRMLPINRTYVLSRNILCVQSPYFKAAFEGGIQKGEEQTLSITEMDGIV
jgi:hypothetical protein